MSFGTSVGDIILLIQLAHKNYRNCKEAGGEYIEIAREVRSLHSVLRTVRDEAERKDSLIFNAGPEKTKELAEIADGCKGVLEGIDVLLTKYKGLAPESVEVGKATKFWQRIRFGTEIEDLGKLRWKIITYTSTLAVVVDSINLKATERVGDIAGQIKNQMETGFADMQDRMERFEDMRKAVLFIATRARASQRYQAMESVLSLSTYADDDKEVWKQFRKQLVSLGFKSDSLDRHMEVLKAYMMRLDQTGVLDEAVEQSDAATQSWCGNASFRTTNLSLLGTVEMGEEGSQMQVEESNSKEKSMSSVSSPQPTTTLQPPRVDEGRDTGASPSSPTAAISPETATIRRRRIPRIKVEQPDPANDSRGPPPPETVSPASMPVKNDGDQVSSSIEPEPEIDFGIDVSKPRQPRPYAESYYSVSEAATSQSTLLRGASDFTKPSSASRESRPKNPNRPTSWSGPDTRKPKSRTPSAHVDNNSDSESTVGKSTSGTRRGKDERTPAGSKEKVDDWLKLPSQQRRTRASSSPTRQKPSSRSNEELNRGEGNTSKRPSSASNSGKNVKFDSPKPFDFTPPEEIFKQFMSEEKKFGARAYEKARPASPSTSSSRPSGFTAGWSTGGSKAGAGEDFFYRRTRHSRSPEATVNGEEVPPSQFQQAAKVALIAGAVEAFRVRNEAGSWSGDKAKRILTAAIGAGSIDAATISNGRHEVGERPLRSENGRGRPRRSSAEKERGRSGAEMDSETNEYDRDEGRSRSRETGQEDNINPETAKRNRLLAAVLGGLAANQLIMNKNRRRTERGGKERGVVASESEHDSDSEFGSDSELSDLDQQVPTFANTSSQWPPPPRRPPPRQQQGGYQQGSYSQQGPDGPPRRQRK